ncbi:MAG: response regulator [Nevskia sp.]|nr:response regulator [Nevskia sp.]
MKVLVVEDDPIINKMCCAAFRHAGCEVASGQDGLEGVRLAASEQPDAILMDLMMPRMNGYIATRMIKTDAATGHIPVVALTAVTPVPEKARLQEMGFADYCVKPMEPAALVERVTRIAWVHRQPR